MRLIRTVTFTVNEIHKIEDEVNSTIKDIHANGGKVINITNQTFGLSPMNLIYTITYEE